MENKGNLTLLRKEITSTQVILIVLVTILLSAGGMIININSNNKSFNQNLQNTSALITRLYSFTKNMTQTELCVYMDSVVSSLSDVDIFSIVDKNNTRIYHTHHQLINTQYDGDHPDFSIKRSDYFTEDSTGPSGPQRRTYSAVYAEDGNYQGFIMTIQLKTSMRSVTIRTILLFLVVTIVAILIELAVCATISKKIKKEFLRFTEDFEGTKFLVDSMRANNHDFTNKLHVILGLIQIGEYEKAQNYIQNISIIQRETVTFVMRNIENPSLAALLIGKIARASECNVKFSLKENSTYKEKDIDIPSEALVTITGNLIDNALDALENVSDRQLRIMLHADAHGYAFSIANNGPAIPENDWERIFEPGVSSHGEGRGMGLYIVRRTLAHYGGDIHVTSDESRTVFSGLLPQGKERHDGSEET